MDISAYLERLGLSEEKIEHTYAFLCRLQYAHTTCVPYENLDLVAGVPLSLDPEDVFDKVVGRHRGGYCFELNCLLAHMLEKMGFTVRSYLGRVWRGEVGVPVRRHRVLAVACEGKTYLVDVGVGNRAPRYPLLLAAGLVQEQCGEAYKLEFDAKDGWTLYERHGGEFQKFFSFTEEFQYDIDFLLPSFYCEKHKDSIFNKEMMVAIKTATGRKTLNHRTYKIFEGEEITHIEENMCDERRRAVLKSEFGIAWEA